MGISRDELARSRTRRPRHGKVKLKRETVSLLIATQNDTDSSESLPANTGVKNSKAIRENI